MLASLCPINPIQRPCPVGVFLTRKLRTNDILGADDDRVHRKISTKRLILQVATRQSNGVRRQNPMHRCSPDAGRATTGFVTQATNATHASLIYFSPNGASSNGIAELPPIEITLVNELCIMQQHVRHPTSLRTESVCHILLIPWILYSLIPQISTTKTRLQTAWVMKSSNANRSSRAV